MKEFEEDYQNSFHGKRRQKHKKRCMTANVSNCKYDLVRSGIEASGFAVLKDDSPSLMSAFLFWHDSVVPMERFQLLKDYQRINHFPGMGEVCRKDLLARNMAKMKRTCSADFNFTPRTWNMPSEYTLLLNHAKDSLKGNKRVLTYIQKPANGAMGNGIQLYRSPERIQPTEHTIVQEYLDKPLLLDGYKFDLRLYVLVTSCDPLRIFLYQDGLVRLSTEKYSIPTESNVKQVYMHLTNYSVNKQSGKFERHSDFDRGSKRSIKSLLDRLKASGYDTATLWYNITDMIVKTMLVASPHLLHAYRMCRPGQAQTSGSVCFEVLGFDIFIDKKLKPWLLEVNRAPSFGGDEKIDRDIKGGVIRDALRLVNIRASDKRRHLADEKAATQRRLFTPVRSRRSSVNTSPSSQRKLVLSRRKEELKQKLVWARKEAVREEFEDANLRGYRRIFPCADKRMKEKYRTLQASIFKLFHSLSAPYQKSDFQEPKTIRVKPTSKSASDKSKEKMVSETVISGSGHYISKFETDNPTKDIASTKGISKHQRHRRQKQESCTSQESREKSDKELNRSMHGADSFIQTVVSQTNNFERKNSSLEKESTEKPQGIAVEQKIKEPQIIVVKREANKSPQIIYVIEDKKKPLVNAAEQVTKEKSRINVAEQETKQKLRVSLVEQESETTSQSNWSSSMSTVGQETEEYQQNSPPQHKGLAALESSQLVENPQNTPPQHIDLTAFESSQVVENQQDVEVSRRRHSRPHCRFREMQ